MTKLQRLRNTLSNLEDMLFDLTTTPWMGAVRLTIDGEECTLRPDDVEEILSEWISKAKKELWYEETSRMGVKR